MMKNCQHNLIHQLSETMDSLWRMDQYRDDAQKENCSYIFLGHSHICDLIESNGITYGNSGCAPLEKKFLLYDDGTVTLCKQP